MVTGVYIERAGEPPSTWIAPFVISLACEILSCIHCCSCGSNLGQSEHRKICTCRKRSGIALGKTTLFDPPPSFTVGVSAGTEKNEGTEAKARCWHQAHMSWTGFLHAFLPVHINPEPQCPLSFQLFPLILLFMPSELQSPFLCASFTPV